MAARSVLLAAVAALAARPLAATPGRLATGSGCARSITSGNMMGSAISVTGASTQIQLAKGGNTIACGGTLTAGDTGLTLVKGTTGAQYLIEAEMSAGTGAWGIISGSCNMQRTTSLSNTFTVPPSGTVKLRIAHAPSGSSRMNGQVTTSADCTYTVSSSGGTTSAGTCSASCAAEFIHSCMPFHAVQNRDGYATCRAELDRAVIPQQMANAGCVSGCADTADMAAEAGTGVGSGGASTDTVCQPPMVFESNAPGSPQLLCSTNLCAAFSSRGDACR
jgi:hypothetical protein